MFFRSLFTASCLLFANASFAQTYMCNQTEGNYTAITDGTTFISIVRKFTPPLPVPLMKFKCLSTKENSLECQLPYTDRKILVTFENSTMEIEGLNDKVENFNCFTLVPPPGM